jgi:hypothetical protein
LLYAIITTYVAIGAIYLITSPFCGSGSWSFVGASNGSSRYLEFGKSTGDSVLELLSTPTKISGVHYVQVNKVPFKLLLVHLKNNPYCLHGYTLQIVLFMNYDHLELSTMRKMAHFLPMINLS